MRALLKPDIARHLGVVLLKPGSELMSLFASGRVLVEAEPKHMARLPSGRVPDAPQPLAADETLTSFFTDERVISAAGGINSLEAWLKRYTKSCQYPHSDYHHKELVTLRYSTGAVLLCWSCDNKLRQQTTQQLESIARQNVCDWVTESVLHELGYSLERELSLSELCWWAVYIGIADAITESMAKRAFRLKDEPILSVYKESDITPTEPATSILSERAKNVNVRPSQVAKPVAIKPLVKLQVDPESPETHFARPKRRRWQDVDYLKWVKTQPCAGCNHQADDAHHLIGHGQGGVGTKAHDSFTIPLCRICHDQLHRDPRAFEQKHGSQLEMMKNTLDRAFALGVLA